DAVPDEILSVLLLEHDFRKCEKGYIHYAGEKYWSKALYNSPGKKVMIKFGFSRGAPEYVDVFTLEGLFIGTAYPDNSDIGPDVTPDDVGDGQRMQRQELGETVTGARQALRAFDAEHGLQLTDGDGSAPPAVLPDSSDQPASTEDKSTPQTKAANKETPKPSGGEDLRTLRVNKLKQSGGKQNV
ncbi:MAG TPA: Mu transposase C-terminal domain-containing protein, partial [Anaerovoracaceae bacterium]|nr:Mu transposase C-terminal domain-containing protein [Anaerovoracaceae bacterium]